MTTVSWITIGCPRVCQVFRLYLRTNSQQAHILQSIAALQIFSFVALSVWSKKLSALSLFDSDQITTQRIFKPSNPMPNMPASRYPHDIEFNRVSREHYSLHPDWHRYSRLVAYLLAETIKLSQRTGSNLREQESLRRMRLDMSKTTSGHVEWFSKSRFEEGNAVLGGLKERLRAWKGRHPA